MPFECIVKGDKGLLKVPQSVKALMIGNRLEGRKVWLKDASGLSFLATGSNLNILKENIPGLLVIQEREQVAEPTEKRGEYKTKMKPMDHQAEIAEKMLPKPDRKYNNVFAVFADVGTGKTKVALDRAGQLFCDGYIDALLVIAPKGVHAQWILNAIPQHLGIEAECVTWPIKDSKRAPFSWSFNGKLVVFSMNWEAMRSEKGVEKINDFFAFFGKRTMMVADESHKIKNKMSTTWDFADTLGKKAGYKLALTGTPIATNLADEWSQICWLEEDIIGIRHKKTFINEYLVLGGFDGDQIVGMKNLDRFRQLVDPYTYSITREQMGHPPPVHERWTFDLTPMQLDLIAEIKKKLIAQIDSGEITKAANTAIAFMRMQQISNGYIVEDVEEKNVVRLFPKLLDNPRIAALKEFRDATPGKLAIWCRFKPDIAMVKELLGADNCVELHGDIKEKERATVRERFLDPDGPQNFLATPGAGGTGVDYLQFVCNRDIFYSSDDNFITRYQAEGRIDRLGATGIAIHTDLFARKSVDGRILSRHKRKKMISDMAIGDIRAMLLEDDDNFDQPVINDAGDWTP